MAGRDVTIADVKNNCPEFENNQCPYTGLKGHLRSPVLQHGCIVKPDQCKTLGEVTDVLASVVPKEAEEKKAFANDLQDSVRVSYIEMKKKGGKRCPALAGGCPFALTKEGKAVIDPPSAIGSVFVKKADIEKKCKVFNKGKACPYKLKELNGLAKGCPAFTNGCPYKDFKDVGELKEQLGKMRDECHKGKENYLKALKLIQEASKEGAKVHGHCPFFKYGCHFVTDLNDKPIEQ